MFHPSAATDTLQGRAIQKINEVWGEEHRGWVSVTVHSKNIIARLIIDMNSHQMSHPNLQIYL